MAEKPNMVWTKIVDFFTKTKLTPKNYRHEVAAYSLASLWVFKNLLLVLIRFNSSMEFHASELNGVASVIIAILHRLEVSTRFAIWRVMSCFFFLHTE